MPVSVFLQYENEGAVLGNSTVDDNTIDNVNDNSNHAAYEPPSFQDMGSFRGETGAFSAAPAEPQYYGIK